MRSFRSEDFRPRIILIREKSGEYEGCGASRWWRISNSFTMAKYVVVLLAIIAFGSASSRLILHAEPEAEAPAPDSGADGTIEVASLFGSKPDVTYNAVNIAYYELASCYGLWLLGCAMPKEQRACICYGSSRYFSKCTHTCHDFVA